MPFWELFDETLDINSTDKYELVIQINFTNITFCILDSIRNKYILLRSFEADDNDYFTASKIDEIMQNDDFLNRKYKKATIIIPTEKSTLVPIQLYDPAKKDEYLNLNHLRENNAVIFANKMTTPEAYSVFEISKSIYDIITSRYLNITLVHHLKPLLNHVCRAGKNFRDDYIHLHIEKDFFNLIILNSNSLIFCNSFTYRNANDILYYVMNVLNSFEINRETIIHLSGLVEKYDDMTSAFSVYIRQLKLSQPSGNFSFGYVFNESVLHRYINLFNLPNCV
jgi:hypothetical protein